MTAESVRQPLLCALLVLGAFAGWRLSKLKNGDVVDVPKAGFYRGTTKPLRVAAGAFGGAVVAFLLRLLSEAINSTILAYVCVGVIVVSIGVGAGAILLGVVSFIRSGGK